MIIYTILITLIGGIAIGGLLSFIYFHTLSVKSFENLNIERKLWINNFTVSRASERIFPTSMIIPPNEEAPAPTSSVIQRQNPLVAGIAKARQNIKEKTALHPIVQSHIDAEAERLKKEFN